MEKRSSENLSSADIAVVLGNAVNRRGKPNPCLRSRVEAGVRLYRQGKVGELLMSGGTDNDGSNEAQIMRDMAVEMGVPSEKIRLEEHSESTYENIVLSVPKLRGCERNHHCQRCFSSCACLLACQALLAG